MEGDALLTHNLNALACRKPALAKELARLVPDGFYRGTRCAKDGSPVPLFFSGYPAHSLYSPLTEAERAVNLLRGDTYPVFLGLGAGYAIRDFLRRFPEAACAVAELSKPALASLLSVVDLSDLLRDRRVELIPELSESAFRSSLRESYLPALHGGIQVIPPSVHWLTTSDERYKRLGDWIHGILAEIAADFSVQSHFGRLWNRNFWRNLRVASSGYSLSAADTSKKALIAAAGPGLEAWIGKIREERSSYCVIATDTAYGSLDGFGIVADYFVSIDAQLVSRMHASGTFHRETTVILELCGNAGLAETARRSGSPLFFVAGEHPLSRIAAERFSIPSIRTGSGTVTLAARDVAALLGFREVTVAGADFKYARGKPYARGTYLREIYGSAASRTFPEETQYSALLFRTPISRAEAGDGLFDYGTPVLDTYAAAFDSWSAPNLQRFESVSAFDYDAFAEYYRGELRRAAATPSRENPVIVSLLPFLAWYRKWRGDAGVAGGAVRATLLHDAIQLALTLIAGYTGKP